MEVKSLENSKKEDEEALKLATHIEKLYILLKNEQPKIEIRKSYLLSYGILFAPWSIAVYECLFKKFIIYKNNLHKFLENEEDKDAAILGIAVHEVVHAFPKTSLFFPGDIKIAKGIVYEAMKIVNSTSKYKGLRKLDYEERMEYDAKVKEYIARILYTKLRNNLEEDEILKIIAEKVINKNCEELLNEDFENIFKIFLRE